MQGWHYGKGLIYYRPIFRLTKLAFLRADCSSGTEEGCRGASPVLSFVLFHTLSGVWLQHLFD